jgi:adenylate cyclase
MASEVDVMPRLEGASVRRHSVPAILRQVRLACGLVLLMYVVLHLANHALGLISLGAMEWGRGWFLALWRTTAGTAALYTALLAHAGLALWIIARRPHFRMPAWEGLQTGLGLAVPLFLIGHIVGTRVTHDWYEVTDSYTRQVLIYWHLRPELGVAQTLLLLLAWTHGCVGVHFWLRFRPWYPRLVPVLYAVALLIPVLALLGFAAAGRDVTELAAQPGWAEETLRRTGSLDADQRERLLAVRVALITSFGAATGVAFLAPVWRRRRAVQKAKVRIRYAGGREVIVPVGLTVLEASRLAGIPHTSVCGGRGRCSTCRILVTEGVQELPAASVEEAHVLTRIGAPPDIRLACQLAPTHNIAVMLIVGPAGSTARSAPSKEPAVGEEREIAVLFADLRGFTRIAEQKLPYDVVLILNQYCHAAGTAIELAGGIVNQFTGDGVMALFGLGTDPDSACRDALHAARAIGENVAAVSEALAGELDGALRVGIGIHTGSAVVGRMGYGGAAYLTAVGDTVNVASRLEQLTKDYECDLMISEPVALRAHLDVSGLPTYNLTVRNRSEPLMILAIQDLDAIARRLARPGGEA